MVSLLGFAMFALCAQSYRLVHNYDYTNVSTHCIVPDVELPIVSYEQFPALDLSPAPLNSD